MSGLLVCGRCGYRMTVQYHRPTKNHRYICCRESVDYGGSVCQHLAGNCVDEYVTQQVLQALKPAALELSLAAATKLEEDRSEIDSLWRKRLERAHFEAERAGRHYHSVEPENRLVARQLAQEWESTLQNQQQLQEEYERFCHQQPKQLKEEDKQLIRELADNLPKLWSARSTTYAQRKEIIRQVIQKVIVKVEGDSEQVQATIEWVGGDVTQDKIIRPVAKWTQLSRYPQLCQRLEEMVAAKLTTIEMITLLHQEGFHPPKQRKTFNPQILRTLIRRLGFGSRKEPKPKAMLDEHEWWLPELAAVLNMPAITLYNWVKRGWVHARQLTTYPKHWIIWADEAELDRLRTHRQCPTGEILQQRWRGEVPSISVPPQKPQQETH